ncbi:MAG: GAF domain-containing protein [Candidatus Rokubacteria bacterium]|nr:GAF domain-containing protein [Candidatus Rokubacteria bacterium]
MEALGLHEHLCLIHETPEERLAVAVPFIATGLARGEQCVYIAEENTIDTVVAAIRAGGIDVDAVLRSGALRVLTQESTYLEQGVFDPDRMIRLLAETVESAKALGFSALRVTGDMTWTARAAPGAERLLEYEAKVNELLARSDITALCQYDRQRVPPRIMPRVLEAHPRVVFEGRLCANFYYVPPEESLTPDASSEVTRLLGRIVSRERVESELRDAARRMAAVTQGALDCIILMNAAGTIVEFNPAAERTFGYRRAEAVGRTVAELMIPARQREAHRRALTHHLTTGESRILDRHLEMTAMRRDGAEFPVELTITRVSEGAEPMFVGFVRDISDRKRAEEAAERRRREAESLSKLAWLLSQSLDLKEVSQRIVDGVRGLLGVTGTVLYEVTPGSDDLMPLARSGEVGPLSGPPPDHPQGAGAAETAVHERRPVVTAGVRADVRTADSPKSRMALRPVLALPLLLRSDVIGALSVHDRPGRVFTEDDVRLARAFADCAAVALQNARLYTKEARREEEATVLARVARALTETLDAAEVGQRVADGVATLFNAQSAAVRLLGPDGSLRGLAWAGAAARYPLPGHLLPPGAGVIGRAAVEGRPVWSRDVMNDPDVVLTDDMRARNASIGAHGVLAVPLSAKGRPLGALAVGFGWPRDFSQAEVRLLQTFADEAAVALENARLYGEATRRAQESENLARAAWTFAESLDVCIVADRVVEIITSLFDVRIAVLRLRAPDGSLVASASRGLSSDSFEPGHVLAPGEGVDGRAVVDGQPRWSHDAPNDPAFTFSEEFRRRVIASGNCALLAVPLRVKDEIIGALGVGDRAPRMFGADEVRLLQAFADQAAIALENARLYAEAERRQREKEVFSDLASRISQPLELDAVLQRVAEGSRELCQADIARIALRDPGSEAMRVRYAAGSRHRGWDAVRIEPGKGSGGLVLVTGRPLRTDDYAADPRFSKDYLRVSREDGIVSQLVVPIRIGDRIEGLIYVSNRSERRFTDEEEATLTQLANHAAIAIHNSQLFAREQEARAAAEVAARRVQESEAAIRRLHEITSMPGVGLEERIHRLLELGCRRLGLETGAFCRIDGQEVEVVEVVSPDGTLVRGTILPLNTTFCEEAVRTAGTVSIERAGTSVEWQARDAYLNSRFEAYLGTPIYANGQLYGTLSFASRTPREDDPQTSEIELLRLMAQWVGLEIERRQAEEAAQRSSDRLTALREIDQAILAAGSLDELLRSALRYLRRLVPSTCAGITMFDFDIGEATILAVDADVDTHFRPGASIPLDVLGNVERLRAGDVRLIDDFTAIPMLAVEERLLIAEGVWSRIAAPLLTQGELLGTLDIFAAAPKAFTAEHIEIAREVAASLAVGIEQARLHERVWVSRERLRLLSRRLVEVQEVERRHIARELHDEIGQSLTGLGLALEAGKRCPDREVHRDLERARAVVADLITRVRDISLDLRSTMLDDLGLVPALVWHFDRCRAQIGVEVIFKQSGVEGRRFPHEIETAAFRIVQEALTNVARHAGVTAATVRLWTDGRTVGIQVEDQGVGFDRHAEARPERGGLAGMRERANLLGGRFEVETSPGAGVRLTAELPLEAAADQEGRGC